MDLARRVYSRELKVAARQEWEAGHTTGEVARQFQLAPKLLERWRGEWRACGEQAFPGIGQRGAGLPVVEDARRIAEPERKIGQLTREKDCLKKTLRHLQDHPLPAVVTGKAADTSTSVPPAGKARP